MDGFGQALRTQRKAAGMRQQDLVEALHHVIARSTLANVEVGRERPSARLWQAIATHLPSWVPVLEPWYRPSRPVRSTPFELSGPYEITRATYVYTFRDHRAPEEILQVRRVKALSDGADGYGLRLSNNSGRFDLDSEALWGGWIDRHDRRLGDDRNLHLLRFHFDTVLARGQEHEFATRSWVSHDEPAERVNLSFTRPTLDVNLVLNFLGPRPGLVWTYGPLADMSLEPTEPAGPQELTTPLPSGSCVLRLHRPLVGQVYGIGWEW